MGLEGVHEVRHGPSAWFCTHQCERLPNLVALPLRDGAVLQPQTFQREAMRPAPLLLVLYSGVGHDAHAIGPAYIIMDATHGPPHRVPLRPGGRPQRER